MERKKLLVIDDTGVCLDLFNFIVNRQKYELVMAKDGEEGIEKAFSERPDLIFLDLMLPRMNGYEVAKAIRKDPALAAIPIIALSARAGEEGKKRALEAGCQEFIFKPFEVPLVDAVLTRFLG